MNIKSLIKDEFTKIKKRLVLEQFLLTEFTSDSSDIDRVNNTDFISALSKAESGGTGDYEAINPESSAIGKYQFLWGVHHEDIMDILRRDPANTDEAIKARWEAVAGTDEVKTKLNNNRFIPQEEKANAYEFIKSADAQDEYMNAAIDGYKKEVKKVLPPNLSPAPVRAKILDPKTLLYVIHYAGSGDGPKYLRGSNTLSNTTPSKIETALRSFENEAGLAPQGTAKQWSGPMAQFKKFMEQYCGAESVPYNGSEILGLNLEKFKEEIDKNRGALNPAAYSILNKKYNIWKATGTDSIWFFPSGSAWNPHKDRRIIQAEFADIMVFASSPTIPFIQPSQYNFPLPTNESILNMIDRKIANQLYLREQDTTKGTYSKEELEYIRYADDENKAYDLDSVNKEMPKAKSDAEADAEAGARYSDEGTEWKWYDWAQLVADYVAILPFEPFAAILDLVNGSIYMARAKYQKRPGLYIDAAFSFIGAIPLLGTAAPFLKSMLKGSTKMYNRFVKAFSSMRGIEMANAWADLFELAIKQGKISPATVKKIGLEAGAKLDKYYNDILALKKNPMVPARWWDAIDEIADFTKKMSTPLTKGLLTAVQRAGKGLSPVAKTAQPSAVRRAWKSVRGSTKRFNDSIDILGNIILAGTPGAARYIKKSMTALYKTIGRNTGAEIGVALVKEFTQIIGKNSPINLARMVKVDPKLAKKYINSTVEQIADQIRKGSAQKGEIVADLVESSLTRKPSLWTKHVENQGRKISAKHYSKAATKIIKNNYTTFREFGQRALDRFFTNELTDVAELYGLPYGEFKAEFGNEVENNLNGFALRYLYEGIYDAFNSDAVPEVKEAIDLFLGDVKENGVPGEEIAAVEPPQEKTESIMETKSLIKEYQLQNSLNPKMWSVEGNLDPHLVKKLLLIAKYFIKHLGVEVPIRDIILTGSNANYNWTQKSDIDLHIILNYKDVNPSVSLVRDFMMAKKAIWNYTYPLQYKGHAIELYAQDSNEPHIATGVFSLTDKKWLVTPNKQNISVDDDIIDMKADPFKFEIDQLKRNDPNLEPKVVNIKRRVKNLRQTGLEQAGEFSVENLAFKNLRNSGYLEKLNNALKGYMRSIMEPEDKEMGGELWISHED